MTEGFGVGGISSRKATRIEYNAAMAILKGIAPLLGDVPSPRNQHQVAVFKALRTFQAPLPFCRSREMKAITDALDSIANVGTPNNPYIR